MSNSLLLSNLSWTSSVPSSSSLSSSMVVIIPYYSVRVQRFGIDNTQWKATSKMQLKIRLWIIPNEYEQFVWSQNIRPSVKSTEKESRSREREREIESFYSILMNWFECEIAAWVWKWMAYPASVAIVPFSLFISPFVFEAAWFPFGCHVAQQISFNTMPYTFTYIQIFLFFAMDWRRPFPWTKIMSCEHVSDHDVWHSFSPRFSHSIWSRCGALLFERLEYYLHLLCMCMVSYGPWCVCTVYTKDIGDVLSNFSIYCVCIVQTFFPFIINLYTTKRWEWTRIHLMSHVLDLNRCANF